MIDFCIETILASASESTKKKSFEISGQHETTEFKINRSLPIHGNFHPLLQFVDVKLIQKSLWEQFHRLVTEMIVTKTGRRMFPILQCTIQGLNPIAEYSIMIDFKAFDSNRYRYSFHQSTWMHCGPADPESPPRRHVHPDSPSLGQYWSRHHVSFDKLKLTNNQMDENGHIILNSMHKYVPQVYVVLTGDPFGISCPKQVSRERVFSFPETEFIAVTAYQNHEITKLKIATNPFAKGFRDSDADEWCSVTSTSWLELTQERRLCCKKEMDTS